MSETKVNRQYKDRLFRLVFKEKSALLELYNALNESNYTDPEELTITTYNPNMPVRGFFYFAELYRHYVEEKKLDLYGSGRIKLPYPKYVVFYNGKKKEPDRLELKLSDSFIGRKNGQKSMEPSVEVRAAMVNINLGHNEELMRQCRKLWEYAYFIAAIRDEVNGEASLEETAGHVIDRCMEGGILKEILSRYRTEVIDMILEEYDEQRHIENERNISREEGRKLSIS